MSFIKNILYSRLIYEYQLNEEKSATIVIEEVERGEAKQYKGEGSS